MVLAQGVSKGEPGAAFAQHGHAASPSDPSTSESADAERPGTRPAAKSAATEPAAHTVWVWYNSNLDRRSYGYQDFPLSARNGPGLPGLLDDLRVYTRALTAEEVSGLIPIYADGFESGDTSNWF